MKNLTWQNPEQLFVAQELINKVKSKCCGIKDYSGSLVLSLLELYVKLSDFSFILGWKAICTYVSLSDVKTAIKSICLSGCPLRISVPLFLIRNRLGFLLFGLLWLLKRLKVIK